MRGWIFAAIGFSVALASASAADRGELRVLSLETTPAPQKMLYTYLSNAAQKLFDVRRAVVVELKTPEDVHRRQAEIREKFLAALGGFPERTPLNARVVGALDGPGCRLERVIYESRPEHHVTASLFLPTGSGPGPFPGVLVPCGHSANGKGAEPYQRACILMAQNGIAVLCFDPIGQGERAQLLDQTGKPAISGSTTEHSLIGVGALLVGGNTAAFNIWDGIRGLDYLAGRPEVDPQQLGCTGNSGGGTLTAYLMALDERIVAAAPSCYITTLERLFATLGPQDAEQNITGQVAFGMEHADYLMLRAPRPTLICVGTRDYFDITGAWTTFREAKQLYGLLGYGERVDLFEYNDEHGFSRPRRQAAMRWMRRWLSHKDDAQVEGEFPIFTDPQLQCTRTGQALDDFKGRSAFDLSREKANELVAQRAAFQAGHSREEWVQEVRRLIGLPESPAAVHPVEVSRLQRDGMTIRKLTFETTPGILVPGLWYEPAAGSDKVLTLVIHGRGKQAVANAGGILESEAQAGRRALALDLRGIGETAPGEPATNKLLGTDPREAFLALHLSRPLLGQRVADVLAVVGGLIEEGVSEIRLTGMGAAGPVALHAALLEPRLAALGLNGCVVSWTDVVHTPLAVNQLTNVVPNALAVYDLPDLAAALAPRPLWLVDPVNALGRPLNAAEVEAAYEPVKKAYASQPERLMLETKP